jgi:hypothetical protein
MNSIEQMIATVQIYIHHRKDVEVKINIRNLQDVAKLTRAYNIAVKWLNENNFKQIV